MVVTQRTSLYFFIWSSVVKDTLKVLGLPTGQVTPFRAILVSLAWSLLLNCTQQVDLILRRKSLLIMVVFVT